MLQEPVGICPNCETRRGPVGYSCPSDVCSRRDYRFIPVPWHEAAREFAARKQRPLDPMLGRSIDRYLVAGKIGEGGMGAVYLAIQRPLNREVALKLISALDTTQATLSRFEREARAISVLEHPNIVKLYDYGIGELEFRVPFMALEYVRHGRTLRRALSQMRADAGGDAIPGDTVLSIFSQILNALGTAHGIGIVHRDMKPDNVMLVPIVGNPHFVKVLDFGLAKAVSDVSGFDGAVSRTDTLLGTPCYMAPEQASQKDAPEVDGRADLYAVAVMIYEVFTGALPFDGETPIEILVKKVDRSFRPMNLPEAQRLPAPLREFLEKGMAVDPAARFADAQEMLVALEQALSVRPAMAVGMLAGSPGSSGEHPMTPPTPTGEETLEPVVRYGASEGLFDRRLHTPTLGHRRQGGGLSLRLKVAIGLAVVGVAVLAGTLIMVGDPGGPGSGIEAVAPEPVPEAVSLEPVAAAPVSIEPRPAETVAVLDAQRPPDVVVAPPSKAAERPAARPARRKAPNAGPKPSMDDYPEL